MGIDFKRSAAALIVGSSPITGGTDTRVLFDDAGVLAENSAFTFTKASGLLKTTALALGGAAIGSNALAVTGITNLGGTSIAADGTVTLAAGVKLRSTAANNLILSGSGANDWFITTGANLVGNNSNAISTGAPSGGTLALWKLGSRVAAVSALDTTQYLQVEVAGAAYKLALIS